MSEKTILLVEDDASDSELFVEALRRANLDCRVHVAASGREAVLYLYGNTGNLRHRPERPDLIVLDFRMAGLTGLQLLQMLHNVSRGDPTPLPPIVAFSSLDDDRRIREAYKLGLMSFVHKPVHAGRYVEAVQQMVLYWLELNFIPPTARASRAASHAHELELEDQPFGVVGLRDTP
jgi:CheY-like chemotaxis protein